LQNDGILFSQFITEQNRENQFQNVEKKSPEKNNVILSQSGWFPSLIIFPSFKADPLKLSWTTGLRFLDKSFNDYEYNGRNINENMTLWFLSAGERIPVYLWEKVGNGNIQISLEAGIKTLFIISNDSSRVANLINADFYFGIPLVYQLGRSLLKFRIYHISSHSGNSISNKNPLIQMKNPSNSALDFFYSYRLYERIRIYAGVGAVFLDSNDYSFDPFYMEYGIEYTPFGKFSFFDYFNLEPFIALHFRHYQEYYMKIDATTVMGTEIISNDYSGDRNFKLYIEFHSGKSLEGQFTKNNTFYVSLNMGYGF